MLRTFCFGCLLVLCAGCQLGLPVPAAVLPTPSPTATVAVRGQAFQARACWGELPPGISAECGFVTVPENRRKQAGASIRLAVMILREEGVKPAGEPTLLLGGGPGQDTIGLIIGLLGEYDRLRTKGYPVAQYEGQLIDWLEFRGVMDLLIEDLAKRDLVVFDQRGAGYSEPSLKCHGERYDLCHERLVQKGIDLSGYNTRENAADVEAIRQAMGYDRINLQAGSYGTRLAIRMMRDFPQHLRAVVLDGVAPPQLDWYAEVTARYDRMVEVVFDHCAVDPRCREAYPNLRSEFYELMGRLDHEPAQLPGGWHIHADEFLALVWNTLYDISGIRWLPLVVHHAYQGDYETLETLARVKYAGDASESMSWGMNYAVECAEEWSEDTRQKVLAAGRGLNPAIAEAAVGQFMPMEDMCREWNVPSELPESDEAVSSQVPTLLLSGEFDPGTPPAFAEVAAATLPRHYSYVFPSMGHTDGFLSRCWSSVQSQFLDNPERAPDSSCIREMPDAVFVTD
jgi:pimeloyl-ACP methyl ester carboxylesterase